MTILSAKIRTSKKHHRCDACRLFLESNLGEKDVTPEEWLIVEECKADEWKINPLSKYKEVRCVDSGEIFVNRFRIDMHNICLKYELFDD